MLGQRSFQCVLLLEQLARLWLERAGLRVVAVRGLQLHEDSTHIALVEKREAMRRAVAVNARCEVR